jgi:NTE family protein
MSRRSNTKRYLFFLIFFYSLTAYAQQHQRPKIGLTLSGGGAKGLAHIGILKALDSAGLQIDYVTGTSMGAVVGSLYAAGYSGDTIYKIAQAIDWNALLLSKSPMNSFIMEEKREYGRYAIEMPVEKGKIKIPSGILEAEELWLKFNELYQPVYNIASFKELPRPFKCIATDIVTGEAVVMEKGNLMNAVRASMAIPSVFTAVNIDNRMLVDGGIIRNFPVSDVKKMGADIVIGSNVAGMTLSSAAQITSPIQILLQVAFFRDVEYSKKEFELCNYLIDQPVSKFSAASFSSSDSIIAIGNQMGALYYPVFKKLADSLNAIYGIPGKKTLPVINEKITIRRIVTDSLKYISESFLKRMLGLKEGYAYTVKELESGMRQAYGTNYFNRLYYQLEPVEPGVADLHIILEESAPLVAKLAVNYNSFSKVMLIANLTKRDMIGKPSISAVTIGLSENPRIRLDHTIITGSKKFPLASVSEIYAERQSFSSFRDFKAIGTYRQSNVYFDTRLQLAFRRRKLYALGVHLESVVLKPMSETALDVEGGNRYIQPYLRFEYNTHDRPFMPRKGTYILLEPSVIIGRPNKVIFKSNGVPILDLDSLGISYKNFVRLRLQVQHIIPFRVKHFITLQAEGAANFNSSQLLFHDFVAGGMQPIFRNQVTFSGIGDAALRTNSLVKAAVNWRYQFSGSVYAAANINVMYHSFLKEEYYSYSSKFLSGYALTVGIDLPIGPVEFSFMYSDQSKVLTNYASVGFRFSRNVF